MPMPRHTFLRTGLLSPALSFAIALPALAQITPDATLGDEASTLTPDAELQGEIVDLIEGGAIRGSNLFHSFQEFNVNEGQQVYFANPDGIASILSRITGGNPSNIFGTLGVDGAADLFLINPNGIVFGENAALDIEGSFYASTAEAIPLGDGIYSATEPEQSSLLTVNPSALFSSYLTDASGDIENRGQLAAQENLTLAANNLDLQGQVAAGGDLTLLGIDAVQIRDTAEVPFIGFAGGDLLVQGNQQVDIVALSHADSGLYSYGDMVLRSANPVGGDAHYWSGGNYQIETLDGEAGELFSPIDPIIRAFGDVEIKGYAGSSLHILAGGSVSIGTAFITTSDLGTIGIDFLQEEIELSDGTVTAVNGGTQPTVDIRAGVAIETIGLVPPGNISVLDPFFENFFEVIEGEIIVGVPEFFNPPSTADILVGDIFINAPNGLVLLTNQYAPNSALAGGSIFVTGEGIYGRGIDARGFGGQGGAVYFDARQNIEVTNSYIDVSGSGELGNIVFLAKETVSFSSETGGRVGAFINLEAGTTGIGGNILVKAANLEIRDGAQLVASTFGDGDAGSIILEVAETARFVGVDPSDNSPSGAFSDIAFGGKGTGGVIEVHATNLEVLNGAQLVTSTFGLGNSGSVILEIAETARFVGADAEDGSDSGVYSVISFSGEGQGGNVEVRAANLQVLDGAQLSASTLGIGNAGSVILEITETARFIGFDPNDTSPSGASSQIEPGGEGKGGNVEVRAANLEVLEGAQLGASTFGFGNAGNVIVDIAEIARFVGSNADGFPSGAFSGVGLSGEGKGGNVEVRATNLEVRDGATLSSSTMGLGDAGSVILEIAETAQFVGLNPIVNSASGAGSQVNSRGIGTGGSVKLWATNLDILDGALLSSQSFGAGNAGNIILFVSDQIRINNGTISTDSRSNSGGQISIQSGSVILRNGGDIQTFVVDGEEGGGNITIDAEFVIALEDSDILAFSRDGRGGNIDLSQTTLFSQNLNLASVDLTREELLALDGNDRVDINASGGIASGQIFINDSSFVENSLTNLEDTIINTSTLTAGSCIARTTDDQGSFVVTGRDSLPLNPGDSTISAYPTGTVQTVEADGSSLSRMYSTGATGGTIQEPDGVYQLPDGRLVLSRECD
jgi:filamentous hemagglutinin family protein